MKNTDIIDLLNAVVADRSIPRSIKSTIEKSMGVLNASCSQEEKISNIISVLDDVSNDPNVSAYVRTQIWSIVSMLEGYNR